MVHFFQNWHNEEISKIRQSGNPLIQPNQYVLSGKKGVQFPPGKFISFFFNSLDLVALQSSVTNLKSMKKIKSIIIKCEFSTFSKSRQK